MQPFTFGVRLLIPMRNVLFICGKNKWRSPTAEQVFAEYPGIQCASAGLSNDAEVPASAELIEWADVVFVMEKRHKSKLCAQFKPQLFGKKVVCLNIPDNYKFMEPALVKLLQSKVTPFLPPLFHG
jgi:predicted protein tyrosine phosphatase